MEINQIQALIEASVSGSGARLIDVVIRGDKSRRVVEVYIDAETGVTTELCAAVSREAAEKLDASGGSAGNYRLEVSSPGIERPLRFLWQYPKHLGRILEITHGAPESSGLTTGILRSADGDSVTIEDKKTGSSQRIPFAEIQQALVKAPW